MPLSLLHNKVLYFPHIIARAFFSLSLSLLPALIPAPSLYLLFFF